MGRKVFGYPYGHWLPTAALFISTTGWYAIITVITASALVEMSSRTGQVNPMVPVILVGVLNAVTAVAGFHRMRRFNRLMVPALLVFCLFLTFRLFQQPPIPFKSYEPIGYLSYGEGIDLIIGSFLAGAFAASDFSRYSRKDRDNWMGTFPGTFLLSFLLGLLGMYSVIITGEWNPVLVVRNLGLGIPAMAFILIANWTTNHNLLYSSGLALTNFFPGLERWKCTMICGIGGTALALSGIIGFLESWLSMLAYVFAPLLGAVLADLFFRSENHGGLAPINAAAFSAVGAGLLAEVIFPAQYIKSVWGLITAFVTYCLLKSVQQKIITRRAAVYTQDGSPR